MRAVIQRVASARVSVDGSAIGRIDRGMLVFLGVHRSDSEKEAQRLAKKTAALRIFPDAAGNMNVSVRDIGGKALVISQFTLYGDASHGNRPSFLEAASGTVAEPLYHRFCQDLRKEGVPVETGRFGEMMQVELVNDGPVTIILES
jgi:D-tyrosyl-tRNA(Tyr) deacylase